MTCSPGHTPDTLPFRCWARTLAVSPGGSANKRFSALRSAIACCGHALWRRISSARTCADLANISRARKLLWFAPSKARDGKHLSALVRSLAVHLEAQGVLQRPSVSRTELLAGTYRDHLAQVRGYARRTAGNHAALARELLGFLRFGDDPDALRTLGSPQLEAFVKAAAARLRSFLRFLAGPDEVPAGLEALIDVPPVYRGETLPRVLPWESVRALLAGVDRSATTGRRDYAMLLLAATYGLRSSEVAGLRLDDFRWRSGEIRIRRPKTRDSSVLPLTDEVGAAIVDYLRNARPSSVHRSVFPESARRSSRWHGQASELRSTSGSGAARSPFPSAEPTARGTR